MLKFKSSTTALWVVAVAFFTDTLLYYLLVPLLPHYAKTYGLGPVAVGALVWTYALALLLGTFPIARWADRHGRRGAMLWGLVGLGLSTLLFTFANTFPLLILARMLQGFAATATWTAGMALVADHFPAEHRGKAMGTVFAFSNLGVLLGPPISGYMIEHFGPRSPFFLAAGLALLDALVRLLFLKEKEQALSQPMSYSSLLKDPVVRVFAGAMALGSGIWALLESTLPIHFDAVFKLSPTKMGLGFALAALAHLLSSPLMGAIADRHGHARILKIGLLAALPLMPMTVLFPSLWVAWVALIGLGLTESLIMSPISPALANRVESKGSQSFASVFGLLNLAYALGMMIGPFLGSLAVQAWGLKAALVLAGLGVGSYSLLLRSNARI